MAKYLKKGLPSVESEAANVKVQETVARIIADVRQRGDAAVRELSERFDGWSPPDFRLSRMDIDSLGIPGTHPKFEVSPNSGCVPAELVPMRRGYAAGSLICRAILTAAACYWSGKPEMLRTAHCFQIFETRECFGNA